MQRIVPLRLGEGERGLQLPQRLRVGRAVAAAAVQAAGAPGHGERGGVPPLGAHHRERGGGPQDLPRRTRRLKHECAEYADTQTTQTTQTPQTQNMKRKAAARVEVVAGCCFHVLHTQSAHTQSDSCRREMCDVCSFCGTLPFDFFYSAELLIFS